MYKSSSEFGRPFPSICEDLRLFTAAYFGAAVERSCVPSRTFVSIRVYSRSLLRSLCFLRLFPITCPDLGVFVALREIFGLNASFVNSFST